MKIKIKTARTPLAMNMENSLSSTPRPLFILIFIFIFIQAPAQPLEVNLESVLEIAGANNLTIKTYQLQQQLAEDEMTIARGWWLPEVYAGLQVHQLWGSAMNGDGRFFQDVNRQNLWAGLGATGGWDFAEGKYQIKVSEIRKEALQFQEEATRTQVLLEVVQTYLGFLSAQLEFETYSLLIAQSDSISQQLQIQAEAGLGYPSDVLMAQSNIRHLQIKQLSARSDFFEKMTLLIGLLNLPPSTELRSTDAQMTPLNLVNETSLPDDLTSAYTTRPELKFFEKNTEALEMEREAMRKNLAAPELQVGAYGSTFGDLFDPQQPTAEVNAALLWRIPLDMVFPDYQGGMKKIETQVAIQKHEMELFKNQVHEDLASAKWKLEIAIQQMEIAEEGRSLARQAFEQSVQRQNLGTARPFEILQAQEMYIRSQLDYLRALTEHNRAQYRMYVALGNQL